MIVDRSRTNLIATIRILDDQANPISGLSWNDPSVSIGYKKPGALVWTNLSLVSGTLGAYLSNSFVEDSGADGLYELGVPDESKVQGRRTLWRFKYASNAYRYDAIDYVAIPAAASDALEFNFNIPGNDVLFSEGGVNVLYIKERGVEVEFQANQDISSVPLVIVMESSDKVDKFIFQDVDITKSGDKATITLPDAFTQETISLNWAIRHATTFRVYGTGSIGVTYAPHED